MPSGIYLQFFLGTSVQSYSFHIQLGGDPRESWYTLEKLHFPSGLGMPGEPPGGAVTGRKNVWVKVMQDLQTCITSFVLDLTIYLHLSQNEICTQPNLLI